MNDRANIHFTIVCLLVPLLKTQFSKQNPTLLSFTFMGVKHVPHHNGPIRLYIDVV